MPIDVLLGLCNWSGIDVPDPPEAPVMPPEIVPTVQLKLPDVVEVKGMLNISSLHTTFVVGLVSDGPGLTVTVIVTGEPAQDPVVEVGVTIYSTLPGLVLLPFVSV